LFASAEVILVAFPGDAAIVDGMLRTIMIASKTAGAPSVVKPLGRCTCYIVDRAYPLAFATMRTTVCIDGELLVGNHVFVKILADDIGEEAGRGTLVEFCYAAPAVSYDAGYVLRLSAGGSRRNRTV
jgi:hypothetical protein